MQFTLPKTPLLNGLQAVQNVVSNRPTNPILTNTLLEAKDGKLTLTCSDLDLTIRCTVDADVADAGATTLPVKRLAGIVRELPEGPVTFNVKEAGAEIKCAASRFRLNCMDAASYPPIPAVDDAIAYTIDKLVFADMLKKTCYAASNDDSRPALNGVLLSFDEEKLTCVATDGRRLALIEHPVEFPAENRRDVILPRRAVNELIRVLAGEGSLRISVRENQAVFSFDNMVFHTKLIEGAFPNYRQVITQNHPNHVVVVREELIAVLRRVTLFTTEKSNSMRLTFENNLLDVTASSPEVGEAEEQMGIKYDGPKVSAIYNPDFMLEPLRALTSDDVFIELNNDQSPCLIKCDQPFLYVLMPLRV